MPNKKYRKGYRLELKVKKIMENQGAEVFRSAGSKGAWDLIEVLPNQINLIQVKANKMPSRKEMDRMRKSNPKSKSVTVSKILWVEKKIKGKCYHDLTEVCEWI